MAMEAAKFGTFDWNMITGEVYWSPTLESMMGFAPGGFEGTLEAFDRLVHQEDKARVRQAVQHSATTGAGYEVEFRMMRADGEIRWVQARGKAILDDMGKPVRMTGVDIDITERKATEERLKDAEKQYADFYDHAPDFLFSIDASNGQILECNRTACEALGYSKSELIGCEIFKLYHADSQEHARHNFGEFLANGFLHNVELQLCRKDGGVIDVSLSASAIRDGHNRVVRSRSICRDITGLKQAQRALQNKEREAQARAEELQAILDAVPAMTFIAHDPRCERMTSSRSAYDLLRLKAGANSSVSAPAGERPTHFQVMKDGRVLDSDELPVQTAARTGQAVRDAELRIAFNDGTGRDIFGHAMPLLDEQGGTRGAVGAFVDITERKKVEEELRKSEARLRRFVDANLIGIFSSTMERNFSQANDIFLQMLGYSRKEFEAESINWRSITPPEFLAQGEEAMEALKRSGSFAPFEKEYFRKDGSRIPILIGAATISDSPLEWMCFVLDLTERRRVEELKRREQVQQQLLEHEILAREEERRGLARELHDESGQMMASLLAGLRVIEHAKSLKEAKTQSQTLRKIAASAMDELGRLSRGLHPLALDDLGLRASLRAYVGEYCKLHQIKVKLRIAWLHKGRLANSVEAGLYRIVQEALTNISKHSKAKNAQIDLKVGKEIVQLTISDDGSGFDANRVIKGSGQHFGLQGMRERAAMMGGEFKIDTRIGGGTIKTFRIPASFAKP